MAKIVILTIWKSKGPMVIGHGRTPPPPLVFKKIGELDIFDLLPSLKLYLNMNRKNKLKVIENSKSKET